MISDVHTMTYVRPARRQDPASGATSMDYDSPASTGTVMGVLQIRSGLLKQDEHGRFTALEAVFYCGTDALQNDDRLAITTPIAGTFRVVGVNKKLNRHGELQFIVCDLAKEVGV